jgi:hypothetical protein
MIWLIKRQDQVKAVIEDDAVDVGNQARTRTFLQASASSCSVTTMPPSRETASPFRIFLVAKRPRSAIDESRTSVAGWIQQSVGGGRVMTAHDDASRARSPLDSSTLSTLTAKAIARSVRVTGSDAPLLVRGHASLIKLDRHHAQHVFPVGLV